MTSRPSQNEIGLTYNPIGIIITSMTKGNGLPCKRCGTSAWYNNGTCIECNRKHNREWKQANRRRHREHGRKWIKENPEKRREADRKSNRKWKQENPEHHTALENKRRTRKTEAGGSYTVSEWKALKRQYDNRCACCGKKDKLTADHVVPVSRGGSSDISNIQPLCKSCNSSKGNRHSTDYRTKPGLLRWLQNKLL